MNIRSIAFWTLDFLRGRRIGRHYSEIKRLMESKNDTQALIDESIEKHLAYAAENVPYYADYQGKKLEDFPVVNKITMRTVGIEQFLSREFAGKKLHRSMTSGSTGIPFTSYRDDSKQNRATAGAIYFNSMMGYELGRPWIYFCRLYPENFKTPFQLWLANEKMASTVHADKEQLNQYFSMIKKSPKGTMIMGYSGFLNYLGKHISQLPGNDNTFSKGHIKSIVASSEVLTPQDRSLLQNVFNAPVFTQYGCMEFGILASQFEKENNDYMINLASFHIEILDFERNVPVEDGARGRIVVTDITNRAMPFIRYDTGDIGSIERRIVNGRSVPVLASVEGRKNDLIYDTQGNMMHGLFLHNCLHISDDFHNILQYQFVQKGKNEYLLKLSVLPQFHSENDIYAKLKSVLGDGADIKFEYVDEIPVISSGKRKMTVNEYIKK